MLQRLKKLVLENKGPSLILALVVLMDLSFLAKQYFAATIFLTISVILLMAVMVNELRK